MEHSVAVPIPQRARRPIVPVLVGLVYLAAVGLWQLFGRGDADTARWVSDSACVPPDIAAIAAAAWAGFRADSSRLRLAWYLVGAAFTILLVGDLIWLAYEAILHISPFPSPADVAYLGFYPLMLGALLAFPVAQRSWRERGTLMLDFGAVFIAAALGVWFLIIGPTASTSTASDLEIGLAVAYPVGDLVVLFGLLAVLVRGIEEAPRSAVAYLVIGVLCFLVADLAFGYLSIHDNYRSGDWPDTLWIAASLLVVLAAWPTGDRAKSRRPTTVDDSTLTNRLNVAPYLLITFAWAIVLVVVPTDQDFALRGLLIGALVLTVLIFARQISVQHEVKALMETYHVLANSDALTELTSRRRFFAYGTAQIATARNRGEPVSVIMIDVDGFKAINDNWGHSVGDAALRAIASTLREQLSDIAVIGRFGGDEFVALLIGAPPEQVERLTTSISSFAIPVPGTGGGLVVRLTAGSASSDHTDLDGLEIDLDALIRAADAELYARRAGRRSTTRGAGNRAVVIEAERRHHIVDVGGRRNPPSRGALRGVGEDGMGLDAALSPQGFPHRAREAEVRRVVAVDAPDLTAIDLETNLSELAGVDLDPGPSPDLVSDPLAGSPGTHTQI